MAFRGVMHLSWEMDGIHLRRCLSPLLLLLLPPEQWADTISIHSRSAHLRPIQSQPRFASQAGSRLPSPSAAAAAAAAAASATCEKLPKCIARHKIASEKREKRTEIEWETLLEVARRREATYAAVYGAEQSGKRCALFQFTAAHFFWYMAAVNNITIERKTSPPRPKTNRLSSSISRILGVLSQLPPKQR